MIWSFRRWLDSVRQAAIAFGAARRNAVIYAAGRHSSAAPCARPCTGLYTRSARRPFSSRASLWRLLAIEVIQDRFSGKASKRGLPVYKLALQKRKGLHRIAFPSLIWTWEHMQKCHCNDHGMIHGTEYTVLVPYFIPCLICLPASVCQHLTMFFEKKRVSARVATNDSSSTH